MRLATVVSIVLCACSPKHHIGDNGRPGTLQQVVTNDLDLLFVVDDSSSMSPIQVNLAANFPRFMDVLQSLPGGLPNVHIGITTTSVGAGAFTQSVPGCGSPDSGNFVDSARMAGNCTAQLNAGAHFIIASADGSANNFTGDLSTLFSCLAQVGANGCGFEQPLAAAEMALGPSAPASTAGFLRQDAYMGVIVLTNEDDCSAAPDSLLFDPYQNSQSDPLGPLASFRCTEFGILCNGAPVPRQPVPQTFGSCTSNETGVGTDAAHRLTSVQHFIDFFGGLKQVQDHTLVSIIGGPPQPFATEVDPHTGFPALSHSCSSLPYGGIPDAAPPPDGYDPYWDGGVPVPPPDQHVFADPAVRLSQFVQSFGERGQFATICQDSYAGALQGFAGVMRDALVRQCVGQDLAMASNWSTRLMHPDDGTVIDPAQIDCSMVHVTQVESGTPVEMETIPPCASGTGVCWQIVGDQHCTSGVHVSLCPDAACANRLVLPSGEGALLRCAAIFPG